MYFALPFFWIFEWCENSRLGQELETLLRFEKKTCFVSRKLFQSKESQMGDKLISTKYRNIDN